MITHNFLKIVLFTIKCLSLFVALFFNFISPFDGLIFDFKFFKNSVGNVSDKYPLEITPADWTFMIWNFIYAFQIAIVVYEITTFYRKRMDGPVYICPGHLPYSIDIVYTITSALNVLWLFAFDNEMIEEALGISVVVCLTLSICLAISVRLLYKSRAYMHRVGLTGDYWVTVSIVHNGFGIYLSWAVVATVLNLGMVLVHFLGLPQALGCAIALSVLLFALVLYAVLDLVLFPKYFRFLFTPLLVVHVALIGSLVNNWNISNLNMIFELAIGACAVTLVVTKLFLACTKNGHHKDHYVNITSL